MRRICGLRPTGNLHIGHYFAVIQPAIEHEATVLIADYHAPEESDDLAEAVTATLREYGVNHIVRQRATFVPQLYFNLLRLASMGELQRMTQYKSTPEGERTAHLLTYPVLMAHDICGYEQVLVGEDQKQHVEFARNLIGRYNRTYPETFVNLPEALLVGGRIMSLTNPAEKMSKSHPNGCLFLKDGAEAIRQKIGKAVSTVAGISNMFEIYRRLNGPALDFNVNEQTYMFKQRLAELLISRFAR